MADVASLAVALHLNRATFNSQFADAMRQADGNAQQFNKKAQADAAKTEAAFKGIGVGVKAADAEFSRLDKRIEKLGSLRLTGLDEMRNVLANLSAGSGITGSSFTTAAISALTEGMSTALTSSTQSLELQRQAQIAASQAAVDGAQASINNARTLREEALARQNAAVQTIQAAQAEREKAFALDEYYAKQAEVNKQYGITASYEAEHTKNARTISEANIAEARGKKSLAEATKEVLAADIAESDAKRTLTTSTRTLATASQELTFRQRAAAAAAGTLRGALALVGGPVGIGIMAIAGAVTMLYSSFSKSQETISGYSNALFKSGQQSIMSVQYLQSLQSQLGDTDGAVKAITASVNAGFGGEMLDRVAGLGARMEELGQSSGDLVSMLTNLQGDPVQAMEKLNNQGIQLNATFIDQIVTLQRQGRESEATALLQKQAMAELEKQIKDQEDKVDGLKGAWKSLKDYVSSAFKTMGDAQMATAQAQASALGINLMTVPAIAGMAKASDLDALAKLTGGNDLDGSQVITSDNAGFILGKNSDLALLKKQGQGGTIAVGSGTPFRVQRSRATTVSPSDTFDDILVIGTDNQTTLPGGLSAGGNIDNTSKGKVLTQAIELSMSTPYIDFHYNGSSVDYTARLIHDRQNRLNAQVQSFWVTDGRITASSTMPANPAIGTQLTSNPVRSLMAGRGAYGDVDGAYVQMYMEEQVGTEHRLVLYADGFGRTDAWIFRAGGTISTGKGDVMTTGSDVRLKDAFTEPLEGASRRINALGVCEFNMKGEARRRRGFIAQQAEKVDDLYTFLGIEQENDGEKFRVMNVDYTAIIADLVTVVQDLIRRVDALES